MLFRLEKNSSRLPSALIDSVLFIYGTQLLELSEAFSEKGAPFIISAASLSCERFALCVECHCRNESVGWPQDNLNALPYSFNNLSLKRSSPVCTKNLLLPSIKNYKYFLMFTSVKFHHRGDKLLAERHRLSLRRVYLLLWGRVGMGHDDCWLSITDTADGV